MGVTPKHQIKQRIESLREKAELARGAMFRITKDNVLSERLVLQGGNALHFIYSSPRHSHDLDFVLRNREISVTETIEVLCNVLSKEYELDKPGNSTQLTRNIERIKYWNRGSDIRGIVEIADQISLNPVNTYGEFYPMLVESANEIYADKIIATLGRMVDRGSLKSTDLFDIVYIKDTLKIIIGNDEIKAKAETYNHVGWDKKTVTIAIDYILSEKNMEKMESDIRKTMMPDVSSIYKLGKDFFENAAECFTKLYSAV